MIKLSNDNKALVLILSSGFLVRLLFWPVLEPMNGEGELGYLNSLDNHFWEYLGHNFLKPPMTFIIHGLVVKTLGVNWVSQGHTFISLVFILDGFAIVLFYKSARAMGVSLKAAAVLFFFLSLYLVPFEYWRQGGHYDHLTLIFNAWFIYCLTQLNISQGRRFVAGASIAGALLLSQNTVFSLVAPVALIVTAFTWIWKRDQFRTGLVTALILISVPVSVTLLISAKNYYTAGVFSPSNLGGVAKLLVTFRTLDRDTDAFRSVLDNERSPEWFKWCFDNYEPIPDNASYDPNYYPVYVATRRATGACAISTDFTDTSWPFDYSFLKDRLGDRATPEVIAALNDDIKTMTDKRYLIYGFAPELSLRFVTLYAKEAGRIANADFRNNPGRYLKTYWNLADTFAVSGGPRFPKMVFFSLDKSGLTFIKSALRKTLFAFYSILQIVSLVVFIAALVVLVKMLIRIGSFLPKNEVAAMSPNMRFHVVMSSVTLLLTVLFSTLVGEETPRYFMYALPYVLFSGLALYLVLKDRRKNIGKTRE